MKVYLLILLGCLVGLSQCDLREDNIKKIEQILAVDYSWIDPVYFQEAQYMGGTHSDIIVLENFDDYMANFKYLDEEQTWPVTDVMKSHMELASFSDQYKTLMQNFKVNKQNGHFEEVLLVSKVDTEQIDGKNTDVLRYQIIMGKVDSVPLAKYTTYTTKSCKCVWYTICIKNECKITTHYTPRAYTQSELTNLETAMRFRTYHHILQHCYKYRDEIEFAGLVAFTEYIQNMELPPRTNTVQNVLRLQLPEIMKSVARSDSKENMDGSIFVNDMENHMQMFEQKKDLFMLTKKYSNEQLSGKRVVANINQMKVYDLSQYNQVIKNTLASIKSNYKLGIQYWILKLQINRNKWNIFQVFFNQNKKSVVTNIILKKSYESGKVFILSNSKEYNNSDEYLEDGTIYLRQFEQNEYDMVKRKSDKMIKLSENVKMTNE